MDNLLLEGIVSELRSRLIGWPVFRVAASAPDEILVLFDDPGRSRLRASACPDLPGLHLVSRRSERAHEHADPFAAAASHHLAGAVLAAIEKSPSDRVVRLRFAGPDGGSGKSLIAELFGRSSNLLVTDPADLLLGAARRLKSSFRAPAIGEPYEPPRGTRARRDPRSLTRDELEALAERSRREDHPLADLILETAPAVGPLAAKEIEARFEGGADPFAVLQEWLARVGGAPPVGVRGGAEGAEGAEGEDARLGAMSKVEAGGGTVARDRGIGNAGEGAPAGSKHGRVSGAAGGVAHAQAVLEPRKLGGDSRPDEVS